MKKFMLFLKNNLMLFTGIICGMIISVFVVNASTSNLKASDVGYDNSSTHFKDSNDNDVVDVQTAIDELKQKLPKKCSTSQFKLGDYIEMTPTSTEYMPDVNFTGGNINNQNTLNPSYNNLWRVIKINDDCTVEVISEYLTNQKVNLFGKTGYKNFIYALNEVAKQYANLSYTLDPEDANTPDGAFRNFGYSNQTQIITNDIRLNDTSLNSEGLPWYRKKTGERFVEEKFGGGDFGYASDFLLLNEADVPIIATVARGPLPPSTAYAEYYISSRYFTFINVSSWRYCLRVISPAYGQQSDFTFVPIYQYLSSSFSEVVTRYYARPIITLKADINVASGDGTSTSHYVLE